MSVEAFPRSVERLQSMVSRIQSRGGQVVFVYMPISGIVRKVEFAAFPREQYWDVLAQQTSAITIHFVDYPDLKQFECPEGHHLDQSDGPAFSQKLASIILEKVRTAQARIP